VPHNVRVNRVLYILLHEDTTLLRFMLGMVSLSMSAFVFFDPDWIYFHENMTRIASQNNTAVMFGIYGVALLYGAITSKFNRFLLFIEGMLGVFVWSAYAWADCIDHSGMTPMTVGAMMAFLLLVRYPTHYAPQGKPNALD
jgi:TRAP-type uncharacterized transport system fused permease subunit